MENYIDTPHGRFYDNDKLNKSAQEVYELWLAPTKPSDKERIEQLEQVINLIILGGV